MTDDQLKALLDALSETDQARVYVYLWRQGMRLDHALRLTEQWCRAAPRPS